MKKVGCFLLKMEDGVATVMVKRWVALVMLFLFSGWSDNAAPFPMVGYTERVKAPHGMRSEYRPTTT